MSNYKSWYPDLNNPAIYLVEIFLDYNLKTSFFPEMQCLQNKKIMYHFKQKNHINKLDLFQKPLKRVWGY